jgi:hypothetical protein
MQPTRSSAAQRGRAGGDSGWLLAGPGQPPTHTRADPAAEREPVRRAEGAGHLAQAAQVIAAHRLSLPTLASDLDAARAVMRDAASQADDQEEDQVLERLIDRDMLRLLPEVESVGVYPAQRIHEARERLAAASAERQAWLVRALELSARYRAGERGLGPPLRAAIDQASAALDEQVSVDDYRALLSRYERDVKADLRAQRGRRRLPADHTASGRAVMRERLVEQAAAQRLPSVHTEDRSWAPNTGDLDDGDLGSYAWRLIAKGWRHARRSPRSRALSLVGLALIALLLACATSALLPALRARVDTLRQDAQPPSTPCVGCPAPTATLAPGAKRLRVPDTLLACDGCANGDVRARALSALETVGQSEYPADYHAGTAATAGSLRIGVRCQYNQGSGCVVADKTLVTASNGLQCALVGDLVYLNPPGGNNQIATCALTTTGRHTWNFVGASVRCSPCFGAVVSQQTPIDAGSDAGPPYSTVPSDCANRGDPTAYARAQVTQRLTAPSDAPDTLVAPQAATTGAPFCADGPSTCRASGPGAVSGATFSLCVQVSAQALYYRSQDVKDAQSHRLDSATPSGWRITARSICATPVIQTVDLTGKTATLSCPASAVLEPV